MTNKVEGLGWILLAVVIAFILGVTFHEPVSRVLRFIDGCVLLDANGNGMRHE